MDHVTDGCVALIGVVHPDDMESLVESCARGGRGHPRCRRLLPTNIEVTSDVADDALIAQVDRGAVEQARLNLLTTARDAMPRGGRIEVELAPARLTADRKDDVQIDLDRAFVRLSVRDSGSGMDEATLTRVFEPFFTTKPPGDGTWLGLAMVYGLMRQLRGAIRMRSNPGVGTAALLLFPAGESVTTTDPADRQRAHRGEETILLVDDNAEVPSATARLLRHSGYPCPEDLEGLLAAGDVSFLPKPWTVAELTRAVRRSLDDGEPTSSAACAAP